MNIIEEKQLDKDLVKQLEKAHYEYSTLKDTFTFVLEQHKDDLNFFETNLFRQFNNELVSKYKEYEKLKEQITKDYIDVEHQTEKFYWEVNFDTETLRLFEI